MLQKYKMKTQVCTDESLDSLEEFIKMRRAAQSNKSANHLSDKNSLLHENNECPLSVKISNQIHTQYDLDTQPTAIQGHDTKGTSSPRLANQCLKTFSTTTVGVNAQNSEAQLSHAPLCFNTQDTITKRVNAQNSETQLSHAPRCFNTQGTITKGVNAQNSETQLSHAPRCFNTQVTITKGVNAQNSETQLSHTPRGFNTQVTITKGVNAHNSDIQNHTPRRFNTQNTANKEPDSMCPDTQNHAPRCLEQYRNIHRDHCDDVHNTIITNPSPLSVLPDLIPPKDEHNTIDSKF